MEIIVKKPTEKETAEMLSHPIWTCEPSEFDWFYGSEEHCLLLEGEVEVKYGNDCVSFTVGDYVVFPKGLSCVWNVKKAVKKHFFFK